MQRDFEELPPEAVTQLREKLVALTLQHSRSSPAVRTQLCLALAAMALHLPAVQWADAGSDNGGGVVMWLWSRFGSQAPDIALPCMLELLTVLPEVSTAMTVSGHASSLSAVIDSRLSIGYSNRHACRDILRRKCSEHCPSLALL